MYPNAVSNELYIALPNSLNKIVTYQITTSSGQTLINNTIEMTNQPIRVDVSNLKTGIYFIKVTSSTINFQTKIIKQ